MQIESMHIENISYVECLNMILRNRHLPRRDTWHTYIFFIFRHNLIEIIPVIIRNPKVKKKLNGQENSQIYTHISAKLRRSINVLFVSVRNKGFYFQSKQRWGWVLLLVGTAYSSGTKINVSCCPPNNITLFTYVLVFFHYTRRRYGELGKKLHYLHFV